MVVAWEIGIFLGQRTVGWGDDATKGLWIWILQCVESDAQPLMPEGPKARAERARLEFDAS